MAGLDDTSDESEAVSKHIGGLRDRMQAAKEDVEEVSVEAPEADDDDEPEAVAPTRREKREGRQTARERAAAAEARAQVLQEQLEQTRRPVPGAPPQRQGVDTAAIDRQIRATYSDLEKLEADYARAQQNKTLTPEMERDMREKAIEIDVARTSLVAERREMQTAPRRAQEALSDQLRRDNIDVYNHPQALQYAAGRATQLKAMGRADDKSLHDDVMEETRRVILGQRPKPDAIERQRATGMSAGPRSAPATQQATVSMPKGGPLYKMACAAYPDLDPGAACQKWAQKVGKKYLANR